MKVLYRAIGQFPEAQRALEKPTKRLREIAEVDESEPPTTKEELLKKLKDVSVIGRASARSAFT